MTNNPDSRDNTKRKFDLDFCNARIICDTQSVCSASPPVRTAAMSGELLLLYSARDHCQHVASSIDQGNGEDFNFLLLVRITLYASSLSP